MGLRNYNVQPRMVGRGVCVWGGGGGGNVIATKKSSTAFSEPKLGPPPNQKFLDAPLSVSFSGVSYL